MVAADTSFLFSLYGHDANTGAAARLVQKRNEGIPLSIFNEFELANAVRFSVYRKVVPVEMGASMLADFEADKTAGRIVPVICNLAEVMREAVRLSASHTQTGGHRAFDILHVAMALVMGAEFFYTFDANQRALAKASGLRVNG
jgi:predicted nucleic acid-binding protein